MGHPSNPSINQVQGWRSVVESLISIHEGPGLDPQYSQKKGKKEGGRAGWVGKKEEGREGGKIPGYDIVLPMKPGSKFHQLCTAATGNSLLGKILNTETFKTPC